MTTQLPPAVEQYFDAKNAHDAAAIAASFAPDGLVHDEGADYRGLDAIRGWADDVLEKYDLAFEIIDVSRRGSAQVVTASVSGNFDGSPANITYATELNPEGLIRSMRVD